MRVACGLVALFSLLLARPLIAQIDPNGATVFALEFTGSQAVPPVSTAVVGAGLAYLDPATSMLRVTAQLSASIAGVTNIAIAAGKPGVTGVELFVLPNATPAVLGTVGPLGVNALEQLQRGELHVVVKTMAHPLGEIRAQLTSGDRQFVAFARGFKCVPPSGSFASAKAKFTFDPTTKRLTVAGDHSGLFGAPTSIFIRHADPDGNGPIVFSLPVLGATTFGGVVGPLSDLQRTSLQAADWYLEIGSAAFPAGEVRGQIVMSFQEYGVGCPGSSGSLRLRGSDGYPTPGGTFTGEITGGAPHGYVLVFRSLGATDWKLGYGCPLYTMLPIAEVVALPLDASGSLIAAKQIPLTVPTPCLVHVQVLAADPHAPNGLFSASNGLAIDITK